MQPLQQLPDDLLVRRFPEPRPAIVCLCGSTRFYETFQAANYVLTMEGFIVLTVGFYPHATKEATHGEGVGHDSDEKVKLDALHKRKIDLADVVLILNVDGYIGDSTRSELAYAIEQRKTIYFIHDGFTFGNLPIGAFVPGSGFLRERNEHPEPGSGYAHYAFEREDRPGETWHRGGSTTDAVPVVQTPRGHVHARRPRGGGYPAMVVDAIYATFGKGGPK